MSAATTSPAVLAAKRILDAEARRLLAEREREAAAKAGEKTEER